MVTAALFFLSFPEHAAALSFHMLKYSTKIQTAVNTLLHKHSRMTI